jgi:hypothetical protein
MSETHSEPQPGMAKQGGEQVASVQADYSRAPGSTIGRTLWRLSIALFGIVVVCAGALSATALWVLFSFPPEPRRSDADTLGSQFEARKGEPLGRGGPLKLTGAARPELGPKSATQGRPEAETASRSAAASGASPPAQNAEGAFLGSGSSSAAPAEPKMPSKETQTALSIRSAEAAARTPQPATQGAEEVSKAGNSAQAGAQCNVNLCAATYASFHRGDCTYQPHGGGPRRICELNTRSAERASQTARAATDPRSEAKDTRIAEDATVSVAKPAPAAPAGGQCHVDLCAATYASFHAADCTYQPYDGGPRRICER